MGLELGKWASWYNTNTCCVCWEKNIERVVTWSQLPWTCAGKPLTIHSWLKKIRLDSKKNAASIYVLLLKQNIYKKRKYELFCDHLYITGNMRLTWLKTSWRNIPVKKSQQISLYKVYISLYKGLRVSPMQFFFFFLVYCIMATLHISALATGSDIH